MKFKIDVIRVREKHIQLNGWAVGKDPMSATEFKVTEENGTPVNFKAVSTRRDDVSMIYYKKVIDRDLGFDITFDYERGRTYCLYIICENQMKRVKFNEELIARRTSVAFKRREKIRDLCNFETLRVVWDNLKEHGVKAVYVKSRNKLRGIDNDFEYGEWYERVRPSEEELARQRNRDWSENGVCAPAFSIVIPVFETPDNYLRELLDSLLDQTYADFEICIADGSRKDKDKEKLLKEYSKKDARLKYKILGDNRGIAGNTNAALEMARGDFIVLCDHDDVVPPEALYECADALVKHPEWDCLYTDEDKLDMDGGGIFDPHFKPDFNIDLLRSVNYICHLFVFRASLIKADNAETDGAGEGTEPEECGMSPEDVTDGRTSEYATVGVIEKDMAGSKKLECAVCDTVAEAAIVGNKPAGAAAGMLPEDVTDSNVPEHVAVGMPPTEETAGAVPEAAACGRKPSGMRTQICFDPEYDGAQDYDFIFRVTERAAAVGHVPHICYHWRCHMNSTASNPQSKLYAFEAGARAIRAHYDRVHPEVKIDRIEKGEDYGIYHTYFTHPDPEPLISVVIPNKDHTEDLDKAIRSLMKGNYHNLEFIVVENNSTGDETWEYYDRITREFAGGTVSAAGCDTAGSAAANGAEDRRDGSDAAVSSTGGDNGRTVSSAAFGSKAAGVADSRAVSASVSPRVKVVRYEEKGFNFSRINNYGVQFASGDYYLFMNNDVEMINPDSISEMMGYCRREDVGIVGCRLLYEDDSIQHAGVVVGFGGIAGHTFIGLNEYQKSYFHRAVTAQDYSAVTAACLLTKKEVFEAAGGFSEDLAVAFNDIDYCLKVRSMGRLVVYDPYAVFHHYESKSRGLEDTPEKVDRFNREVARFMKKWPRILQDGDPYYNPNLTLRKSNFALRDLLKEQIGEPYHMEGIEKYLEDV